MNIQTNIPRHRLLSESLHPERIPLAQTRALSSLPPLGSFSRRTVLPGRRRIKMTSMAMDPRIQLLLLRGGLASVLDRQGN